jgi:hypothetical protein
MNYPGDLADSSFSHPGERCILADRATIIALDGENREDVNGMTPSLPYFELSKCRDDPEHFT